jgi:hypothetical protein
MALQVTTLCVLVTNYTRQVKKLCLINAYLISVSEGTLILLYSNLKEYRLGSKHRSMC